MSTISKLYFSIALLLLCSCEYTPIIPNEEPEVGKVSFKTDVEPIFTDASCINCHDGSNSLIPDFRTGKAYNSIISKADLTNFSYSKNIYDYAKPSGKHNNKYKSDVQAATVKAWIEQGKPDN